MKTRKTMGSMRTALVLLSLFPTSFGVSRAVAAPYFPLETGCYWIYRGETKWLQKDAKSKTGEVKSKVLTWKMEVRETCKRDDLSAALIKGFPEDLAWYEPDKPRGDYLMVRIGTGAYYLFKDRQALDLWVKLKAGQEISQDEICRDDTLFLDCRLAKGKVYGGTAENRAQQRYCWVVEGERAFNPKRFPAAPVINPVRDFTVAYHSNPEDTTVDFVPGIGIVGYQYVHHGTTSETDLGLIEFGMATTAMTSGVEAVQADNSHEPEKGSPERKAIMDALRILLKRDGAFNAKDVIFEVEHLKVHNGWAWAKASPLNRKNGKGLADCGSWLLHLEHGCWQNADFPDEWLPDGVDPDRDFVKKLQAKYPGVPADIFF